MFPVMNITATPKVIIKGCPLSKNQTLATFLERFIIGRVGTVAFWGIPNMDRAVTPKFLQGLSDLESLHLASSSLNQIPNNFFSDLKKLRRLDLVQNHLHLTKDIFISLGQLHSLELRSNRLQYLDPGIFRNQKQMEDLSLRGNKLKNLSKNTFIGASSVTYLDLSGNELTTLEYDVFQLLPNLHFIDLSWNNFSTLPKKLFSKNQKLQSIRLNGNKRRMESLPSDFLAYHSRMINVSISASITCLTSETFANQIHLIYLDLSRNELTNLHDDVFKNTVSLEVLRLSSNRLKSITRDIFRNLHKLVELDLRYNDLHSIDLHAFKGTHELRILRIEYNNLSSVSSGFGENEKSPFEGLSKLEELILQKNRITHVSSGWIHSLPNLKNLDLSYNRLICNCSLLPFVRYLNRSNHHELEPRPQISTSTLYCSEPEELKGQDIMSLNYKQMLCQHKSCPSMCICWTRYDQTLIVNCSSSNLAKVPSLHDVLTSNIKSIVLHIANNNITTLPDNHSPGYSLVSELYASNNSISRFAEPNIPTNLQVLDLSNNTLTQIDATVFKRIKQINQTSHLYFGDNPWQCDCNALGLLSFIRTNSERIQDLNFIKCSTGARFSTLFPKDLCKESIVFEVLAYIAAALGVIFVVLGGLSYRFRTEIKVWLFAHNMCWHLVTEQNIDDDKKYDAFISYSHKDEDFVIENLLPNLENGPIPYKLCLHERDWLPGEFIHTQIIQSVNDSRRTIIVLSPNYLESVWGSLEFQIAYKAALEEARTRIIIIMYRDIGNSVDVGPELKSYLNTNTYIKWDDPWFWEKMRHAMPHPVYRQTTNFCF
ncbi:unnamed protein product [Hermetia illucens]|uniref:TIR domain-containing protein n=2 Tax=Hermetia illucens TaxID=343691 RepID=A0A7R8V085_HERIL|nr:unnamed protein product [Hermetia illucens]